MLNSETWNEFVKMQAPAMQGLMGRYLEQSAQTFLNMQNQLTTQTRNLWGNFPFPGFPGAGDSKKDGEEPKS
jgi:polyhydroxyalkanoate synthesis regulator protein